MPAIEVEFYTKENGEVPVQEFLDTLDEKMSAKVLRTIKMLEKSGTTLREPYFKHISNSIFELRAQVGTNISRVLYFFIVNGRAVLTHGFIKKTQQTPQSEIDKAKRYREDYLRRLKNNDDKF